jgi:DegV family protein with EDD domain
MIALITDSTSDLSPEQLQRSNAVSVPLYVLLDGQNLKDGVEINSKQIFEAVERGVKVPSTSQPSPAEFAEAYQNAFKGGASEVLSIHISGKTSGTVQSARLAAQDFAGKVTVVDSESITVGLAMQVLRAGELIKQGHSMSEVVSTLESVRGRMDFRFGVDTLDYLKKNGRIGGAQAMIGGLLGIKPILKIADGRIDAAGRARGNGKMMEVMVDFVKAYTQTHGSARVMYGATPGGEGKLSELRSKLLGLPLEDLGTVAVGAVVSVHAGPGAMAMALEPVV